MQMNSGKDEQAWYDTSYGYSYVDRWLESPKQWDYNSGYWNVFADEYENQLIEISAGCLDSGLLRSNKKMEMKYPAGMEVRPERTFEQYSRVNELVKAIIEMWKVNDSIIFGKDGNKRVNQNIADLLNEFDLNLKEWFYWSVVTREVMNKKF